MSINLVRFDGTTQQIGLIWQDTEQRCLKEIFLEFYKIKFAKFMEFYLLWTWLSRYKSQDLHDKSIAWSQTPHISILSYNLSAKKAT